MIVTFEMLYTIYKEEMYLSCSFYFRDELIWKELLQVVLAFQIVLVNECLFYSSILLLCDACVFAWLNIEQRLELFLIEEEVERRASTNFCMRLKVDMPEKK